jgi:hypothetical protein
MKISLSNRLSVLLRERRVPSASEFARLMTAAGFTMSSSNASRYERESPPSFDLTFVATACNVLSCLPNELYGITITLEPGEAIDPRLQVPRHALVVTESSSADAPAGDGVDESAPRATHKPSLPKAKAAPAGATRITSAPNETAKSTGPSGALFPFPKK